MENLSPAITAELLTLKKVINPWGSIQYINSNGEFHRIHGPAIIDVEGNKFWYQYNELHREGGPAVEWTTGAREYWYHGCITGRETLPDY